MLISPTGFMSVTSMTGNSCAPLLFLVVLSVTVCRDGNSYAQDSHPVFRDTNDSARTKLNEDWQAMPELHRHSGQAQ